MSDLPRVRGKFDNIWENPTRKRVDGKKVHLTEYGQWRSMYYRSTLGSTMQRKSPTYIGCTRALEWDSYDVYIEWARQQVGFLCVDSNFEPFQLDKDVLFKGNKHYSPDTCVFVPREINIFNNTCKSCRGMYPLGVSLHQPSQKFTARAGKARLGSFTTTGEAFAAYKGEKELQAKTLAIKYAGLVDPRVIDALNNFTVNIED